MTAIDKICIKDSIYLILFNELNFKGAEICFKVSDAGIYNIAHIIYLDTEHIGNTNTLDVFKGASEYLGVDLYNFLRGIGSNLSISVKDFLSVLSPCNNYVVDDISNHVVYYFNFN